MVDAELVAWIFLGYLVAPLGIYFLWVLWRYVRKLAGKGPADGGDGGEA